MAKKKKKPKIDINTIGIGTVLEVEMDYSPYKEVVVTDIYKRSVTKQTRFKVKRIWGEFAPRMVIGEPEDELWRTPPQMKKWYRVKGSLSPKPPSKKKRHVDDLVVGDMVGTMRIEATDGSKVSFGTNLFSEHVWVERESLTVMDKSLTKRKREQGEGY